MVDVLQKTKIVSERADVELVATDRCDRCGARAQMRALKELMELLMCTHHGNLHKEGLAEAGFSVTWYNNTK